MSDRADEQRGTPEDPEGEISRRTFLQVAGVTGVVVGAMLPHLAGDAVEAAVTGSSLQGMAEVAGFGVSPDRLQQLSAPAQGILSAIAELRRLDIPEVEPVTVYRVPKA